MHIEAVTPTVSAAGNCFVEVLTDAGDRGIGQAGFPHRGQAVAETVRSMQEYVVGEDPRRIEHLWQVLSRGGFFPGGIVQSAAVSAVDIALWDLKAKLLEVPLYELLGGRTRDEVRCYAHVAGADTDALVAECESTVEAGWDAVRWDLQDPAGPDVFEPGRAVDHEIERFRAVRAACGPELDVIVDGHTRLDIPNAIKYCRAIEEFDPYFVEDPIRTENLEALQRIRDTTAVPLAIGEQFDGKWRFQQALEADLMEYCRVDVTVAGGLTESMKIANLCETHPVPLAPHNPTKLGPIATAATLHFALAAPTLEVMELGAPPGNTRPDLVPEPVPYESGRLLPPEGPGLGITVEESALEASTPPDPPEPRVFDRDDGSITNW